MTSKHHRWQTRWQFSADGAVATHETGVQVDVSAGRGVVIEPATALQTLAAKNGPHNAPIMLQRMVREAEALATAGAPRDARI